MVYSQSQFDMQETVFRWALFLSGEIFFQHQLVHNNQQYSAEV